MNARGTNNLGGITQNQFKKKSFSKLALPRPLHLVPANRLVTEVVKSNDHEYKKNTKIFGKAAICC